jgi:GT2 family glycosyltransferase
MIRRSVFEEIGGFDPLFRVAFGDVDLCLKARQKGYHIVWTPYAELYHFESQTRGQDDHGERKKRASEEAKYLEQKWKQFLDSGDPFFNPNLTVEFFNYLPAPNKCRQEPRSMRGLAKP